MGNPFASPHLKHLEHDVQLLSGFVAIDGAKNVIGQAPTNAPLGAGPYSLLKGCMKSVGIAGAVVTQPYQSVGFYQFTLDEPWIALIGWNISLFDQGANPLPVPTVRANVRSNTTGPRAGVDPGTETGLGGSQIVNVKFRLATTGALTDLTVSTGFWMQLFLKRTAIY